MPIYQKLIDSLRYSVAGLRFAWNNELSLRLEVGGLVVAAALGAWRGWSLGRWTAVLLAFALVVAAELVNTAVEALADYVQPKRDRRQAPVYDAASAAVFVLIVWTVVVTVAALIWPR